MLGLAHPRHWWRTAALDGLVPLVVLCGVSAWMARDLLGTLHQVVLGGGVGVTPSDINGTLWFYWWTENALGRGADLLHPDVICAPTGQALGSNFPQHVDAMLAMPLFRFLEFPLSYNLWVLLVPVLGGLAAHVGARWLGLGRLAALMVAVLFGFNALSIHELANGKPPSALVFTLPLFAAAWIRCLQAKGRKVWPWVIIAGFTAALAIQHYVLYALLAALFGFAVWLWRLIRPHPNVPRIRPLTAGFVVLLVGLTLSAPYLKRLVGERRPMVSPPTLSITDPLVLRETKESNELSYVLTVDEAESLPRRAAFPAILTLLALLFLPLGDRRQRAWALGALCFYLLSLGPMAALAVRPEVKWLTIAGRGVPLPTWWLNLALPYTVQFFHPCRVLPMVVFCAGMSTGFGLSAAATQFAHHWGKWIRFSAPIVALIGLLQVWLGGGMVLLHAPWAPNPFLQSLSEQPEGGAIMEFPVGLGHATAPAQLVHGWARSESHHDAISMLKANTPPEDCYQLPMIQALWDISRAAPLNTVANTERPIASSLDSEAITAAHTAGFRYVVAWRGGFDVLRQAGIELDPEVAMRRISAALGAPLRVDDELVVWKIPGSTP